jgi:hypothetical protein
MQLQVKIEQVAKEYQLYKTLFEEQKQKAEKIHASLAEKALKTEDKEDLYNYIFDNLGRVDLLQIDMNQMKIRLYHYLKLAEDLVEIPQEIKDLVEDYKPQYVFTTSGEIANKTLYEKHKKDYISQALEFEKFNNKSS